MQTLEIVGKDLDCFTIIFGEGNSSRYPGGFVVIGGQDVCKWLNW